MIFSDKQYTRSKRLLGDLRDGRNLTLNENDSNKEEWVRTAELGAIEAQIAKIEEEVSQYEELKEGKVTFSKSVSLHELPRVLVEARIAQGLSQSVLARILSLKPQQIQRYEATNYMGASLSRLIEIASVLRVQITSSFALSDGIESGTNSPDLDKDFDWTRLPLKEMVKRQWITPQSESELVLVAKSYVNRTVGHYSLKVHRRRKVRSQSRPDKYHLIAWQSRVIELAQQVVAARKVSDFSLGNSIVTDLVSLTTHKNGPANAREMLLARGIVLVFEKHIPNTDLDGAAMLLSDGTPVIGLTLRLNRIDNFWYTLFHELGHVLLHLTKGVRFAFFDQEEANCSDLLEEQADRFAMDNLISEIDWSKCVSPFVATEETVFIDAEKLGVHPAIVAGRIRKERSNYKLLSALVQREQIGSRLEVHDKNSE
ncbi:MAG: XRE family transcriptional regulator [Gammaproteobacteria bacterium]|nr:XRE family transcriptional regulator [Gammaproteobacteria bacterium]